jgi:deferrochelatase/peroxidase EfeB
MHALVTSAISFDSSRCDAVEAQLQKFNNPAARFLAQKLDALGTIHFMSITVVRPTQGPPLASSEDPAHLIFELNADGAEASALAALCDAVGDSLSALLATAGIQVQQSALPELLLTKCVRVGQSWFSKPGLVYDGTPGMTVQRIRREADLAAYVTGLLERPTTPPSALARLEEVRSALWNEGDWKWAFVAEPAPILSPVPSVIRQTNLGPVQLLGGMRLLPKIIVSLFANFLWPFLLLPLALLVLTVWRLERSFFDSWWGLGWSIWGIVWGAAALILGLLAGFAVFSLILAVELLPAFWIFYDRVRRLEKADRPDDTAPDPKLVADIMSRENFAAQNHMAAVSTMKPGRLRKTTLRLGLWAAGQIAQHFSRPGFLATTGEIHFARWILLPGTDKLLFFSNYDGGWESYLEDFIERSAQGVSGIWSNTIGFPKTVSLFFGGASDGDRLRWWTRRQQRPTLFWYSGYPSLTQDRIRLNAAIAQGVANVRSEADAEDWLSCFGSAPRPADSLEIEQIPTLVFGGLRRLPYARCLLVALADRPEENKAWLRCIEGQVSYGNRYVKGGDYVKAIDSKNALVVGFTRTGLEKLGREGALKTFPAAFVHGSAAPWRARPLGDVGANAPETWLWGGPGSEIDAIVLLYGSDSDALAQLTETQGKALDRHGLRPRWVVELKPAGQRHDEVGRELVDQCAHAELKPGEERKDEVEREPFGFVDGISDPVLRGVGDWTRPELSNHVVEPGEFVLGYPDSSGLLPCSPTVPVAEDPTGLLPAASGPNPNRQRPNFTKPKPVGAHDLGFNGTYLVVRQLEQDVTAFQRYLRQFGARAEVVAAKMVGRWKDGASLVRYPLHPSKNAKPDNDFLFGVEDADGVRCPLGAHIRRANPRDQFDPGSKTQLNITNRHRILRVGRSYTARDNGREKPGLLFMCLNSDIERQFEFLQQTWLFGSSFSGLQNEVDPLLGHGDAHLLTIPTDAGPRRTPAMADFVQVLGSGYFFLPGKKAMNFLAGQPPSALD